ncbi:zinc-binding alcohol dehydrogenase family protein [Rhizobium sp. RU20A]|uniref:zinc-binding alcohol dehydrogenase family protein n=1 Tax=Rhizobium sp. RU20A TaxID=1907412 RepID=UPI00122C67BB|nr:zinc-binding alcohol dehydrogenase family protein [Rhizobium sp. RU20A]
MKSIVCVEPGRLVLEDRPRPQLPDEDWVRIRVTHVGICGTDYHIYQGKHPFLQYPRVMGHEVSGVVIENAVAAGLEEGTPVIINPYISCGACHACNIGKPNCCMSIKVLGVHTDGAFCEEIVLPAGNVSPAIGLSSEASATVEFLAIGAHAVRRSQATSGSRALVIGAGPIGLGAALFARIAGQSVTLLDTSQERLDMARERFGFDDVRRLGGERPVESTSFDTVYDATGNAASMESAFAYVAHGGALVLVGLVKDDLRFSDPEFHKREMMLIASRNAVKADFEHVAAALSDGRVSADALITHRTSIDRLTDTFPGWAETRSGLIKAMVSLG